VGRGPFSLSAIHKERLCLSSEDIDDDDEKYFSITNRQTRTLAQNKLTIIFI
jgi:hypothetical protein